MSIGLRGAAAGALADGVAAFAAGVVSAFGASGAELSAEMMALNPA